MGLPESSLEQIELQIRSGLANWVIRQGKPLVFTAGTPELKKLMSEERTKAALCVPLMLKDEARGAIVVASTEPAKRFDQESLNLLETVAAEAAMAIDNAILFDDLTSAHLATVSALATAVDAKDPYTHGHSERVARYVEATARKLGLSEFEIKGLKMAAYLHDIGKIGISERILLKPGKLTEEEMAEVKKHSLIGVNILAPVKFPWEIASIIRHHHEHYDGSGYPAGLKDEEIPLGSRIIAVADAFEAMTAERPYRSAKSEQEALEELKKEAGAQFDPEVVEAFSAAQGEGKRLEESHIEVEKLIDQEREERLSLRVIFMTISDSLLRQYRLLAGSQMAQEVVGDLNSYFVRQGWPFRIENGHLVFTSEPALPPSQEAEVYREALEQEIILIERAAGTRITEHFYLASYDSLTKRFRQMADFYHFDKLTQVSSPSH